MRYVLVVLTCVIVTLTASSASAQDTASVRRTPQGVMLDFQNADIRVVISALAEIAGVNVVFSTLPARTVTLRTSVPIAPSAARAYLTTMATTHGLELVEEGGLIRISGDPDAAAQAAPAYTQPAAPQEPLRLFVHTLQHARAEAIAQTVSALFGTAGSPLGDPWAPAQSLTQELRQQRMTPLMPQPAAPAPQPTPAQPGAGLAAGLQAAVQIVPDSRSNSLLIRATPADYETIRAAIQALDTRPLQVMIEVLIAEVRRDGQFGLGISVAVPDQRHPSTGVTIGGSLVGGSAGDLTLRISNLGKIDAEVLIRALAAEADATILSRPVILAQNNQEARILVGSQRPFIQLFRALPTDNAVRDQVVQYRDVGTQLTIRPTINLDGYVSMQVLQEISTATTEVQFGAPVISTREAQTELMVRDGHTAVIGGLLDHQREVTMSGIPFLQSIPLLGYLFRSTQRKRNATEVFLFLTPHVIRTDDEMESMTEQLRLQTEMLRRRLPAWIPLLPPDTSGLPPDTSGAPGRSR